MATLKIVWSPPLTRASGKPLKPADIAGYTIESSLDGAPFAKLTDNPASSTERDIDNIEAGDWKFRVACFDTKNHVGGFFEGSITVEDDTPPGLVLNLTLSVSASLATQAG